MNENNKILTYSDLIPRYNRIGEWKPLVCLGDIDAIGKEVYELTKAEKDKRIYGAMYYIKATSFNAIEFIIKSHFEIPSDFQQIGSNHGKMQFHKLNFSEDFSGGNMKVYDGTLELGGDGIEEIKNGLAFIDIALHRLVFRLDTKLEWFIKYHHHNNSSGLLSLTVDDMNLLWEYLAENLRGNDSIIFDVALSWYVNGNNSNNSFIKFLSYCIAMESLADNFLSGKMEVSSKYGINKPEKIEEDMAQCIKDNHDKLYNSDPVQFVQNSYFNCMGSIQKKLRKAMEIVFGENHQYLTLFFDKMDKFNIYDLRSRLAHGSFTILDNEHKELIENKLQELRHIVYEFILRLSTGTPKDQVIKKIASRQSISILFNDPRNTGVTNNLNQYQNKDWRIKPEWLF